MSLARANLQLLLRQRPAAGSASLIQRKFASHDSHAHHDDTHYSSEGKVQNTFSQSHSVHPLPLLNSWILYTILEEHRRAFSSRSRLLQIRAVTKPRRVPDSMARSVHDSS
jgi:hypothetical protein